MECIINGNKVEKNGDWRDKMKEKKVSFRDVPSGGFDRHYNQLSFGKISMKSYACMCSFLFLLLLPVWGNCTQNMQYYTITFHS